jgi:DNA excision repair protein ERCC-6
MFAASRRVNYFIILKKNAGKRNSLYGIDALRKICNHPDLLQRDSLKHTESYGSEDHSCKMKVVKSLLNMWKLRGNRSLLFCQTRQMQDILTPYIKSLGYSFLRMDGTTPIKDRQSLVDEFNNNLSVDVFILVLKNNFLNMKIDNESWRLRVESHWGRSRVNIRSRLGIQDVSFLSKDLRTHQLMYKLENALGESVRQKK